MTRTIAAVTGVAITAPCISRPAIAGLIAATSFTDTRASAAVTALKAIAGIPARVSSFSLLFLALPLRFLAGFFHGLELKKSLVRMTGGRLDLRYQIAVAEK